MLIGTSTMFVCWKIPERTSTILLTRLFDTRRENVINLRVCVSGVLIVLETIHGIFRALATRDIKSVYVRNVHIGLRTDNRRMRIGKCEYIADRPQSRSKTGFVRF